MVQSVAECGPDAAVAVRPAALIGCDATGTIVSFNLEAEALFLRNADQALGLHISALLPDFPFTDSIGEDEVDCAEIEALVADAGGARIDVSCTAILMPLSSRERLVVAVKPYAASLRLVDVGADEPADLNITQEVPVYDPELALVETPGPGEPETGTASVDLSLEVLRNLIAATDDIVWSASIDRLELLYINPAGERAFGRSFQQLATSPKRWLDAVHPDDRRRVRECFQFLHKHGAVELECRIVRPDGVERWLYTRAHAHYGFGGELLRADGISSDITERKQREMHLARLNRQMQRRIDRLSALHQIDSAISTSQELGTTLGICLDHLRNHLNVDAARILVYDPYTQRLRYAAGMGFRHGGSRDIQRMIGTLQAGKAALGRCTIFIPDISSRPEAFSSSTILEQQAFVSYYAIPLTVKGQVKGILEIFQRSALNPDDDWSAFARALAAQAAVAIDASHMFDRLQQSNNELCIAYDETIEGWSHALDLRDKETEGHSRRVTEMTLRLAKAMGANHLEMVQVRRGALLHDIGKMGIPDTVLLKPGPLTDEEWVIMRKHPVYAYDMLSPIDFLRPALDIPFCHHEKWDGTGYPRGLKGVQIPLAARIFAVVDVWDALRSDRPYRAGWPVEKVVKHILSLSGSHFDPQVVEVFLSLLENGEFDDLVFCASDLQNV